MRMLPSLMAHRIVLAAVTVVALGPAAVAHAAIRMTLVRAAHCGADCPLDTLRRGVFEISTSRSRGSYGIEGRLRVKGAVKNGKPVDLGNLKVILPFQRAGGNCADHYLHNVAIAG